MKVIDKLIEIANGVDVGSFKIPVSETGDARDNIFGLENGRLRNTTSGKWIEVELGIDDWEDIGGWFLNQEVEEVEVEKEIELEKLDIREKIDDSNYLISTKDYIIQEKINEIIDAINDIKQY